MTSEQLKNNRLKTGWLVFMILAGALIVIGFFSISNAFAINQTAINEVQADLIEETTFSGSYHVFWLLFLLVVLAVFMFAMMKMREDRETVFFSLGALIVSIMITLLFTSPLSFDFQESQKTLELIANDTQVIQATVTTQQNQIILIPYDSEFRFALVALFTGITLFNGLYSIYILTNFHTRGFNKL